jgi:hypothetical protein
VARPWPRNARRDHEAHDRADALGERLGLVEQTLDEAARPGVAPADRLALRIRKPAAHRLALDALAGGGAVLLGAAFLPDDVGMVGMREVAVARPPPRVVGEGALFEEVEKVGEPLRRERADVDVGERG